jgi:putative ABC transport system permease protein
MISEIRYVFRSLLRRKGFALVTVLTLALGLGSATAIYSVVDWVLFRPVPSPDNLYMVGQAGKDGQFYSGVLQDFYLAYKAQAGAFSEFAAASYETGNVIVDHDPVANGVTAVTLNLLPILGVAPGYGRGFVKGEDVDGRNQVLIVTAWFSKKNFGSPSAALGKRVIVDRDECMVVGVLREGQRMPPYVDNGVFRPLVLRPNAANPWRPYLFVFGLAKPGVSRTQAIASLESTRVVFSPGVPNWFRPTFKPAVSTIGEMGKVYRPELYWMLVGAVGFLFAIACLNASNLMLVHMAGRQLETSIRLALGGGRWGIMRLLLIETVGLCVCGSALGALIANWLIPVFQLASNSGNTSEWTSWNLGWRTYVVLGGLSVFTGLVIALVPGLHALRSSILGGLKNGGGSIGETPRVARVRATIVVLQATFAVVLLVGAGLMIRTFQRLEQVKLGFDPSRRIKIQMNFPDDYPSEQKERLAKLNLLRDSLLRVPGVSSVAFGSESLLAQYDAITMDMEAADGSALTVPCVYASADYQQAGGIVLKRGTWLRQDSKGEVVINEALAHLRFGNSDPVGQYLKGIGVKTDKPGVFKGWRIVGVVGDVRESLRAKLGIKAYLPAEWSPGSVSNFVVDMTGEPSGESTGRLRQAVFRFDPRIVVYAAGPVLDQLKEQLRHEHLALAVLQVLSVIAILLTIVGLFSVLAYTVERRMPEFGVRMALGATPADLISLVMRRGMALTGLGIVIGIAGAMGLTRYLQSLLFETAPYDAGVIAAVVALLLISALGACALPAVRASKPDVARLLKGD